MEKKKVQIFGGRLGKKKIYCIHMSIKLLYLYSRPAQEKTKLVPNFNISLVIYHFPIEKSMSCYFLFMNLGNFFN